MGPGPDLDWPGSAEGQGQGQTDDNKISQNINVIVGLQKTEPFRRRPVTSVVFTARAVRGPFSLNEFRD